MATSNPFDVSTSKPANGGLVATANPALGSPNTPKPTEQTAGPAAPTQAGQATNVAPQLSSALQATTRDASATQAGVAQGTGTMINVDPAKQTVQGQLATITSQETPLFQQAVTRATQQMAQRGLVNSSLGVTAAESAILDKALPIAQQDAQTYQSTATSNADIANQFESSNVAARNQNAQFNADALNTAERQNSSEANATSRQNAQFGNQVGLANLDAQTKLQLQNLDANTRTGLANIEANYKTLMQSSQSASDMYRQSIDAMTQITLNKDLSADAKSAALTQQARLLENGLNLIGATNNLNLSGLLTFDETVGGTPIPAGGTAAGATGGGGSTGVNYGPGASSTGGRMVTGPGRFLTDSPNSAV